MATTNLFVGWITILAGLLIGAGIGMFFHDDAWLGGYASWQRRMLRLTHISMVGTGLLNLAFALSSRSLNLDPFPRTASWLFVAGAATMPLVCALSAWRRWFRHLFFIPVLSLVLGTASFLMRGLMQ